MARNNSKEKKNTAEINEIPGARCFKLHENVLVKSLVQKPAYHGQIHCAVISCSKEGDAHECKAFIMFIEKKALDCPCKKHRL